MKNKSHDMEVYHTVQSYVNLDYPILLNKGDRFWVAEHPNLPGCKSIGETQEEALQNLKDAKISWLFAQVEAKKEIPLPNQSKEIDNYSGKVLIRIPKELHFKLMNKAKLDGISLNQEILYLLTQAFEQANAEEYFLKIMNKLDETTKNSSKNEQFQLKKLKIQEDLLDFVKMFNSYLSMDDNFSSDELDLVEQALQQLNEKLKNVLE